MVEARTLPPMLRVARGAQLANNQFDNGQNGDDRQSRDEWLATLSHELRSPLATILDALELVVRDLNQPGAQRAGEIAQRQAHKAMRLIDDLFDLNAHARGKLALHKRWVNLADVV